MNIGIVAPFNPYFISSRLTCDIIPNINTSANSVNTLVLSLLEAGNTVSVYTSCGGLRDTKCLEGERVKVFLIPTSPSPKHKWVKGFMCSDYIYMPRRIRNIINKNLYQHDVLHAHWTYEYAMAVKPFVGKLPVFVTVRDWAPYILTTMKTVVTKINWMAKLFIFRKVMSEDKITFVANSTYTYNKIKEEYPGKEVPIIPNPILKTYIIEEKINKGIKHRFISIAVSLDDARKNINKLLEAFQLYRKKYNEAKLDIIGSYNKQGTNYTSWKEHNLLENVTIHGAKPHDEVIKLIDLSSCLIHPSLEETFGNILLEAMSRCVICIGGEQSGAVPLVLGKGEYGIVCDITNPYSIVEAMEKQNDELYTKEVTRKATEMLKTNYSSEVVAKMHMDIYKKSMNTHQL